MLYMRNIILILLCAVMCLSFCACGGKTIESTPEAPAGEQETAPAEPTDHAEYEERPEPEENGLAAVDTDGESPFDTESDDDTKPLVNESGASASTVTQPREETAPDSLIETPAPSETDNGQEQQDEASDWSPFY